MRKVNPVDVKAEFITEIDEIVAYADRVSVALAGTPKSESDKSNLFDSVFMDAYVAFESFVSELFLAYMNHDFTPYQNDLAQRISSSLIEKFGPWAESKSKYTPVSHLPIDRIEEIVDPEFRIITFQSSANMLEKARRWISTVYNRGIIEMPLADQRLIDTARSIRNYIAHRSEKSFKEMNDILAIIDGGPPNADLGRGRQRIDKIGAFLKAKTSTGRESRLGKYLERLKTISGLM